VGFLIAGATGYLRVYTKTGDTETQTRSWRQRKQDIRQSLKSAFGKTAVGEGLQSVVDVAPYCRLKASIF
jgi:hypothetical protein